MNLLITSCGIRVKIVEYFRNALNGEGKVFAADCSSYAPALYAADGYFVVPRVDETDYIDHILSLCSEHDVRGVFSLIDPELSLLARNAERFAQIGTTVIGSDYEVCELCHDKWSMYQWMLEKDFPCARTYVDVDAFKKDITAGIIGFPAIVKPIRGSASVGVEKVFSMERTCTLMQKEDGLMIQQFMDGLDMDADCCVDMISGEVLSVFTKHKLLMRAGEADKAISFYDPKLDALLRRFISACGLKAVADIDVFKVDGEYYLSEVNPRFGGVYPHAHGCGLDFPAMIINNLRGNTNVPAGQYATGMVMMKYPEIMIRESERGSENGN